MQTAPQGGQNSSLRAHPLWNKSCSLMQFRPCIFMDVLRGCVELSLTEGVQYIFFSLPLNFLLPISYFFPLTEPHHLESESPNLRNYRLASVNHDSTSGDFVSYKSALWCVCEWCNWTDGDAHESLHWLSSWLSMNLDLQFQQDQPTPGIKYPGPFSSNTNGNTELNPW